MEIPAVLATVGLGLLGLLGYVVLDVFGQIAVNDTADALSRRPSVAERRSRSRGLMRGGVGAALMAATAGFIWLAAATSGHEDDADDARVLGIVTATLALIACGLLAAWWRRSGAPRR